MAQKEALWRRPVIRLHAHARQQPGHLQACANLDQHAMAKRTVLRNRHCVLMGVVRIVSPEAVCPVALLLQLW